MNPPEDLTLPVRLHEHNALRGEILQRIRMQHQLILLCIVSFGVLLGLGLELGAPRLFALHVLLTMFIAASWQHSGARTVQLKTYMRDDLEPSLRGAGTGWEAALAGMQVQGFLGACWFVSTKGLFLGSQMIAIVFLWLARSAVAPVVLALSVGALAATAFLLRYPRIVRAAKA